MKVFEINNPFDTNRIGSQSILNNQNSPKLVSNEISIKLKEELASKVNLVIKSTIKEVRRKVKKKWIWI